MLFAWNACACACVRERTLDLTDCEAELIWRIFTVDLNIHPNSTEYCWFWSNESDEQLNDAATWSSVLF